LGYDEVDSTNSKEFIDLTQRTNCNLQMKMENDTF
jgi:hypothetical protein